LKWANNVTTEFEIDGMTCGNCARHVTEAIQSVPDVRSAAVSLENKNAVVRWNASKNVPAVLLAVKNAGYEAKETTASDHAHAHKDWQLGLWLGIVVTAFLMAGEWFFQFGSTPWFIWTSFALAAVVQIYAGAPFYRGAWRQMKTGSSNMDTLVTLGSTTAFGYSTWALLSGTHEHLYFMEAAAIITLISLGHSIEARVSERAGSALKALLHLAPQTAQKISSLNSQLSTLNPQEVPVSELEIGDEILLRPGDRVPVDGVVREGESAVDESTLTGESAPVEKKTGGELLAGTTNLNGRLVMRVTATGEETALAHVIAAVQRAQTSRANIQRLGDRVSSVFVPVVIVIAIAAGFWWGLAPDSANRVHESLARFLWHGHVPAGAAAGFIIAAAVLIIACPCAMGLATPVAIMAGANAAARRGILIRDGVALEKAGKISAIVFDKTGTLTVGKPKVAAVCEIQRSRNTCQSLAAALARDSSHPVSQAIARISAEKIPIESWREIRGAGIEATIQNSVGKVRLGSLPWLLENGIDSSQGEHFIVEWSAHGATIVGLAVENHLLALLAVLDSVKPNADNVIKQLQRQGLKIFLVTGDNSRTAAGIASLVGITQQNVMAEVRPDHKAHFVKKLQSIGEHVAFVGDGINDAPALMQADLGIAVSRASDIAREAADIILLRSDIAGVPEALGLAQATLKTIKQNLFWAFFYNSLGVPLASLGFISPILCAAAMGVSDLIVIGNALRLLQKRKPLA
jgi:Cu+-exporting ATPase